MEAFGAASSATAVVGAVADVAKETVKFLRCLKNAPLAVFALIEEVTQLQSVIDVVKGACESDQCPPSILTLLEQAKARLLDLNCLIDSKLTKEKGSVDTDRLAWVRHERHAKALMERLRNTRNNITAVLSVSTLYQVQHINHSVQQLILTTAFDARADETDAALARHEILLHELYERIKDSQQTQQQLVHVLGEFRKVEEVVPVTKTPQESRLAAPKLDSSVIRSPKVAITDSKEPSATDAERPCSTDLTYHGIGAHRASNPRISCPPRCRCACHKGRQFRWPTSTRKWTGFLLVKCTNFTWSRRACTVLTCKRIAQSSISVQYLLPVWLATTLISAWYKSAPLSGPEVLLKLVRMVRTDAYYYASQGAVDKLRSLYAAGKASIHDVDPSDGESALVAAIRFGQIEVVRFLLDSGARIDQRNFGGVTVEEFALDLVYRDVLPSRCTDELRAIFAIEEIVNGPEFTSLLRIVVGQSSKMLSDELDEHSELINAVDSTGITPLRWAVIRRNLSFAQSLIKHGADLSIADSQGRNVFHQIAREGSVEFANLLLTSGSRSINNTTSRAKYHKLINAPDIYGVCPWHVAVRYNNPEVLRLFVRYGCDISLGKNVSRSVLHLAADFGLLGVLNLQCVDPESEGVLEWTPERFLLGRLDGSDPYAKYCSTADAGAFQRLQKYLRSLHEGQASTVPGEPQVAERLQCGGKEKIA